MLIQFSVENFLSFKDKATFSLLATGDKSHPEHLLSNRRSAKSILRTAAIYGANASGKSNLVKAMAYARELILHDTPPDESIPSMPFRLVSQPNHVSRFQFIFSYHGVEYSYGVKLNPEKILEEFLYGNPKGKEIPYFERITNENNEVEVEFGASLLRGRKAFLEFKAKDTRPNQLFLTSIRSGNMKGNVQEIAPVIEWFRNVLTIIQAESSYSNLEIRTHRFQPFKQYLANFLSAADTGICDVSTDEMLLDWERDLPEMPVGIREEIARSFSKPGDGAANPTEYEVRILESSRQRCLIRENTSGQLVLLRLLLRHQGEHGLTVDFPIEEESDGTSRIIHLIPILFDINQDHERVIVIDELDRRLHPHLSRMLVESALNCPGNHQMIFTSHDTNLLNLDLLRRDEIWFVEKDKQGGSHAYSLAEFKVRPDLQVEKGYLNGRFGAIPFVGDIQSLGWNCSLQTDEVEVAHAK